MGDDVEGGEGKVDDGVDEGVAGQLEKEGVEAAAKDNRDVQDEEARVAAKAKDGTLMAKLRRNGRYSFANPNFVGFFGLLGAIEPYVYIAFAIICSIGVAAGVETENSPRPLCVIWIIFGALALFSGASGRSKSEGIIGKSKHATPIVTRLVQMVEEKAKTK